MYTLPMQPIPGMLQLHQVQLMLAESLESQEGKIILMSLFSQSDFDRHSRKY